MELSKELTQVPHKKSGILTSARQQPAMACHPQPAVACDNYPVK